MSFADDAHRAYQDFQSRTPFKQYLELPYQIRMKRLPSPASSGEISMMLRLTNNFSVRLP